MATTKMAPLKWDCWGVWEVRGVRGEWGVYRSLGNVVGEGKAPHNGPYLPIKTVHEGM